MSILRPRTSTEMTFELKPRWPLWDDKCAVCGDYDGFHARCWWSWLTEERVIRGYHDGEQQVEPDEPYPSRWWVAWSSFKFKINPFGWAYYKARGWIP